jgi:hypothetical protein
MVYRTHNNTVYSIGGFGSGGFNYKRLNEKSAEWEEIERNHSALMSGGQEFELPYSTSIYFD